MQFFALGPAARTMSGMLAAGILIMACGHDGRPLDYEALERWTRVGYEWEMRSRTGERLSPAKCD